MTRGFTMAAVALYATVVVIGLAAQSAAPPDLSGAWAPYRGGRGADPKLAAPPGSEILLKGDFKKSWDARRAAEAEANKKGEPLATPAVDCIPYGMPRMMSVALYPLEIIQRPTQVTMVTEAFSEVRRIYTDGRKHPPLADLDPSFHGHSIGHWEGDTLVVDTVGMDTAPDIQPGVPHTEKLRIVERIKLTEEGFITNITMTDPNILTRPWETAKRYRKSDAELSEFVCLQENNNFRVDENGILRAVDPETARGAAGGGN